MNRALCPHRRNFILGLGLGFILGAPVGSPSGLAWDDLAWAADPPHAGEDLQIAVSKKGLGKQVVIRKGNKEWFMLIEVTADNTVVVRQVKENETYLVDESETHDRAMTAGEVDAAIEAFINGAKTDARRQ